MTVAHDRATHVMESPWRLMTRSCSALSCARISGFFCSSGSTRDSVAPVVSCPAIKGHWLIAGCSKPQQIQPTQIFLMICFWHQQTCSTDSNSLGGGADNVCRANCRECPTSKKLSEDLVLQLIHGKLQGDDAMLGACRLLRPVVPYAHLSLWQPIAEQVLPYIASGRGPCNTSIEEPL